MTIPSSGGYQRAVGRRVPLVVLERASVPSANYVYALVNCAFSVLKRIMEKLSLRDSLKIRPI